MKTATLVKLLSVSVTEDMLKRVKSIADSDNVSSGQLVRAALNYALERENEWRTSMDENPGKNCFRFYPTEEGKEVIHE